MVGVIRDVFVIAEAGVNHNGDLETALLLVDAAAKAGADAVKFQTFTADAIAAAAAPKAAYQRAGTADGESQLEMLRRLELPRSAHHRLAARCREKGIAFLSTPFDLASLDFLVAEMNLSLLKLPSGEIVNGPLLLAAARSGRDVILSTGMSSLDEVQDALGVLAYGYLGRGEPRSRRDFEAAFASEAGRAALTARVTLLQCTTEYPAPADEINLRAMATLARAFGVRVGLSDHSAGIAVALAAAALGASVIEKHFTLDRTLPGPDHQASLEPLELAALVHGVRTVEKALGSPEKMATPSERPNQAVARKSLVALKPIPAGAALTPDNLGIKRPGSGLSPMLYWETLGRRASRDFAAGEMILP